MIKRFLDGLAFGAGFSIAFAALWIISSILLTPFFFASGPEEFVEPVVTYGEDERYPQPEELEEFEAFVDLPADEQIAAASVIALSTYETEDDGRMRAVISEILKQEEGAVLSYEVGDEYHDLSYYPGGRYYDRGEGTVLLFTGTPPRLRYTTTIRDGRVYSLNNMPVELLRQKTADAE